MNEVLTITYGDVTERCKMLSAYEGRDRHDSTGKNIYADISITPQDEPLISDYLSRSILAVRQRLDDMIVNVTIGTGSTLGSESWELRTMQRRWDKKGHSGLNKHVNEALAASVMSAWLAYKEIQDRQQFYQTVYENEIKLISDNLHTKAAPTRPTS